MKAEDAGTEDWWIYKGTGVPHDGIAKLPEPPAWRVFGRPIGTGGSDLHIPPTQHSARSTARRLGRVKQASAYQADERELHLVNLALHLRRPLLITGKPGVGKSTLAYAVAHELQLGQVLRWPITSRSTLRDGLYTYDAIGRLYDAGMRQGAFAQDGFSENDTPGIGRYLRLGPLGTALLPWRYPRVLLIDEIDKSDIDLPNDLLNVFEEGEFEIPELSRLSVDDQTVMTADGDQTAAVCGGLVACSEFPLVILTSNAEREFPSAFLRRCVRLEISTPNEDRLAAMVDAHLGDSRDSAEARAEVIAEFSRRQREEGAELANDQLLNALLMVERGLWRGVRGRRLIESELMRPLNES
ncbi:MoxR family ATPase [Streptomyces sp. NPDC079167]|uniref:AAA family ATPase n=1 Tax=Streptomyces sp. NPDC079167 TaxID=3154513 RepID=UPI00343B5719